MSLFLHLYAEPAAPALDLQQIAGYVANLLPDFKIDIRDSFIPYYLQGLAEEERQAVLQGLAEGFARAKVRDPRRQDDSFEPLYGEISYELRRLSKSASKATGILYDGLKLMGLFQSLIPRNESSLSHLHVVFTNQLFGTWEDSDRRYHARVIVCGFPCLLSTTGMVEAPAKPREFYLLKQQYNSMGMYDAAALLESQFKGRFIDYDDPRTTEVMKGYVMQAMFFHLTGEAFCDDRSCRLYNAHWQEEMIRAQLNGDYEYCPRHSRMLKEIFPEALL